MSNSRSRSSGFAMLEMVVVVVITSILIVIAVPRIMDDSDARLSTGAKMIRSDITTVRNLAVAFGTSLEITFASDSYSVRNVNTGKEETCYGRFPVTGLSEDLGISINTAGSLTFNSLGEPSPDSLSNLTMRLKSAPERTRQITIESETGYVQSQ